MRLLPGLISLVLLGSINPAKTTFSQQSSKVVKRSEDPIVKKRKEALEKIQPLVERVLRFQSISPKTRSLLAFGDLLWEIDELYARGLFIKAFETVNNERARGNVDKEPERLTPAELNQLRANVITRLSRHDPKLAAKFGESVSESMTAREQVRSAISTLEQPEKAVLAVSLAERGMDADLSGWALTMVAFLQKLQKVNKQSADELFAKVLDRLPEQSAATANDLLTIGTYLYTSPVLATAADPAIRERPGLISFMSIGDALVVDITVDRSGVPNALVKLYLNTAVNLLSRDDRGWADPLLDLAALRLLFAKAQTSMPELVPIIHSGIQLAAARAGGGPDLETTALFKNNAEDYSIDDELAKTEALSTSKRDERLLTIATSLYQRKDFVKAAKVADMIHDLVCRQKLINLIRFAEATNCLETGEVANAEQISKLLTGTAKASLKVAIAANYVKNGDKNRALQALAESRDECNRLDENVRKPFLLLAVASLASDIDPFLSISVLKDSIGSFNSSSKVFPEWFEQIQTGSVQREFPVTAKGLPKDLSSYVERIVRADPNPSIPLFLTLNNETLQGEALVAISKAIWGRQGS